jgi:signal transduction histidine kinase
VLDDIGLDAAIEWQTRELARRTGLNVEFVCHYDSLDLDGDHATALFRILQESLTNVVRHANATHVKTTLDSGEQDVVLAIADDGDGITDAAIDSPKSWGLLGIRERAAMLNGEVTFRRPPGGGTVVEAVIPRFGSRSRQGQG